MKTHTIHQKDVNSLDATVNTIRFDDMVAQWFTNLVTQPDLQAKLVRDTSVAEKYTQMKKVLTEQKLFYIICLICALMVIYIKNYWLFVPCLLLLVPGIRLNLRLRNCVADICSKMIAEDYDESALGAISLYQVSERYSRQYHLPSLVDKINRYDLIMRYQVLAISTMLIIIWPIYSGYQILLIMFIHYHFITALLKTHIFYSRLK